MFRPQRGFSWQKGFAPNLPLNGLRADGDPEW
jgi:hypothetical protein